MSFRARLTSFFVLIVVIPMVAVGVLVFRLINDSQQGKADARAAGLASAAVSLYTSEGATGRSDAAVIARDLSGVPRGAIRSRAIDLAGTAALARVTVG